MDRLRWRVKRDRTGYFLSASGVRIDPPAEVSSCCFNLVVAEEMRLLAKDILVSGKRPLSTYCDAVSKCLVEISESPEASVNFQFVR